MVILWDLPSGDFKKGIIIQGDPLLTRHQSRRQAGLPWTIGSLKIEAKLIELRDAVLNPNVLCVQILSFTTIFAIDYVCNVWYGMVW